MKLHIYPWQLAALPILSHVQSKFYITIGTTPNASVVRINDGARGIEYMFSV